MQSYQTRRALVDDLPQLIALWTEARLPVEVFEKEFTDFQVAADKDGRVLGAIALKMDGPYGKVHSEVYLDFALTDTLRPDLWQRIQLVAKNHGLLRLWTDEPAPWWKRGAGFVPVDDEVQKKLPACFGPAGLNHLTLKLRDEAAHPEHLEKQLALHKEAERQRRETLEFRATLVKVIFNLLAALIFIGAMVMLFYYVRSNRR